MSSPLDPQCKLPWTVLSPVSASLLDAMLFLKQNSVPVLRVNLRAQNLLFCLPREDFCLQRANLFCLQRADLFCLQRADLFCLQLANLF